MKVAFVLPSDRICGGNFVVYEHITRLRERGHDVQIFFTLESATSPTLIQDFELTARNIRDANETFDVAVATWWETVYDLPRISARHFAFFVQSDERRFYSSHERIAQLLVAQTYSLPLSFITEARWIQRMLEETFAQHAALAPNGVSEKFFSPGPGIEPRTPGTLRVLVEGPGAIEYKRVGFALETAAGIPGIEIWHVSSDGMIDPKWPVNRIFPPRPLSKMKDLYRSCDVLLKLSTVEGFFGPPLEMMACGGTAIVSDVSGHEEYVVDGRNALVVPRDDRRLTREALCKLRDHPDLLLALKEEGLKTARQFSWDRSSMLFEQFLETCTASHQHVFARPEVVGAFLNYELHSRICDISQQLNEKHPQTEAKYNLSEIDKQFRILAERIRSHTH